MKRYIFPFALLLLTACGPTPENLEESPAEPAAAPAVVGFDAIPEILIGSGSQGSFAGFVHSWRTQRFEDASFSANKQDALIEQCRVALSDLALIGADPGIANRLGEGNTRYEQATFTYVRAGDTVNAVVDLQTYLEGDRWVVDVDPTVF